MMVNYNIKDRKRRPQGKSSDRTFSATEHVKRNKLAFQKWLAGFISKTRNSPKPFDWLGAVCIIP